MKKILLVLGTFICGNSFAQYVRTDSIANFTFYRGLYETGGSRSEIIFSDYNSDSALYKTYHWLNCLNFNEMVERVYYNNKIVVEECSYVLRFYDGIICWVRHGLYKFYDEYGRLKLDEYWREGVFISAVRYD